jgi:hypothetical protein
MMAKPKKYTEKWVLEFMEEMWLQFSSGVYLFKNQFLTLKEITAPRYSEWRKEYKDNERIQTLFQLVDQKQEEILLLNGLSKRASESLTKFMLINHHDWQDKKEVKSTGDQPILVIGKAEIPDED